MEKLTLVLITALWCCSTPPAATQERPREGGIELIGSDTLIYPADPESEDLAYRVEGLLEGLDAALGNGQIMLRRYTRQPAGLVPVPDTAATPTEVGVLVDSRGLVLGAVIGEPPFLNEARFTTYVFDEKGRTIGLEISYTDWDNGCAELLDVELRWVLRGSRVVKFSRRLKDQDEYDVAIDECVVGVGERRTILGTWAELSQSVGLTAAQSD